MKWIGWPGTHVNDKQLQADLTNQLKSQDCVPVFLEANLTDLYYNGMYHHQIIISQLLYIDILTV